MTNILIVEDEESLADPLAFLLRKEGFDVILAPDGPTALEEFEKNSVDIVLLDLMLPGMSGTDVCKQLRSTSSVPETAADNVENQDNEVDGAVSSAAPGLPRAVARVA
ncbi:response regulator, partial [Bacteroides fragilis]|nr:response regulator [Bacteroides fragilis]